VNDGRFRCAMLGASGPMGHRFARLVPDLPRPVVLPPGLKVLLESHDRSGLSRGAVVAADMYVSTARDRDVLTIDPAAAAGGLR